MRHKKLEVVKSFILVGLFVLLICPMISAGISSQYFSENPLKMYAGEKKEIVFGSLQNIQGTEDILFKGELIGGSEIAKIIGSDEYPVALGEDEVAVNVEISIPDEANIGDVYQVSIKFSDISPLEGGGMVTLAKELTWAIPIEVIEEPVEIEPEGLSLTWIILGIILIIVVIVVILFLIKNKKSSIPIKSVK